MFEDIKSNKVLENLLSQQREVRQSAKANAAVDKRWSLPADRWDLGNELLPPMYHDYGVVFVGHSLGACLAILLSAMFRPTYPQVRCYQSRWPSTSASLPRQWSQEMTLCRGLHSGIS